MFIILWLFFILLNGKWTLEIVLSGLVIALLVMLFMDRFMDWNFKREMKLVKRVPAAMAYAVRLLIAIMKANLDTIRVVYAPRQPKPAIVTFETKLRSNWGKVLLANSITLTPGTITLDCTEDKMTVHCLDHRFADGLADSEMEHEISELEAE